MVNFGKVIVGNVFRSLVVDIKFEISWVLVNELDGVFGFEGGNGSVGVFGNDIIVVE